jgi:hypothetical protein
MRTPFTRTPFRRTLLCCSFALLALVEAQGAAAVGPSLWTVQQIAAANGAVQYLAHVDKRAGVTTIASKRGDRTVGSVSLPGTWGFQVVTLAGDAAGLSANGRVLVASGPPANPGGLSGPSRFAVLSTSPLAVTGTFTLPGAYTVDTLSPDGRMLFLIQHVQVGSDISRYRVRAYDLRAHRLLPRVIADKRQTGWTMRGYPIARAATPNESSVFTLYQPNGNYPFVHALDAVHGTAVCIGLPLSWTDQSLLDGAKLELSADGTRLVVSGPHMAAPISIDTATLEIVH